MKNQNIDNELLNVTINITREQYVEGQLAFARSQGLLKAKIILFTTALASIGLISIILSLIFLESLEERFFYISLSTFLFFPLLVVLGFRYLVLPQAYSGLYDKEEYIKQSFRLTINGIGLHIENDLAHINHHWTQVTGKVDLDEYIVFSIAPVKTFFLPKAAFSEKQLIIIDQLYEAQRDPLIVEKVRQEAFIGLRKPFFITIGITLFFILIQIWAKLQS